jgi:hypothetical protein
MTKEKELLLQDLSARLPYGVKVKFNNINILSLGTHTRVGEYVTDVIEPCKPYLFPMSSMTKEQKREYHQSTSKDIDMLQDVILERINGKDNNDKHAIAYNGIDWLNAHHFDYRGLIEKGLAIDATGKNIY